MNKVACCDSSPERISPRLFSRHSHRLIVCALLLAANYFALANNFALNTAIICMVNASHGINGIEDEKSAQSCSARNDESRATHEFAIPGTIDWSPPEQSLLLSARFYGNCITVAFSGLVAERFGPDFVMSASLLLSSALTIATPLISHAHYNIVLGSRILMGAIESFHVPSINCIATDWFPTGEKTTAAAIYTTGYQLAGGFSSFIASFLCRSSILGGWPSIFYVFGGTSCIFAAFWISFGYGGPAKNRWLNASEKQWLESKMKTKRKGEKRTIPLSRILRSSAVHSILLCNFAFCFSASIMQSFLPLFLRGLGLPIETIGWYTLAPFITQIAGKATFGPLIDYWAGKETLSLIAASKIAQAVGSFGTAIALLLLSLLPSCDHPTVALYILMVYGVVYAGCACGSYTSLLSISPQNIGTLTSLACMTRIAAAVLSTTIVNALTATEVPYKWTIIFAIAAVVQSFGGLHYIIFGTTEEQSWD